VVFIVISFISRSSAKYIIWQHLCNFFASNILKQLNVSGNHCPGADFQRNRGSTNNKTINYPRFCLQRDRELDPFSQSRLCLEIYDLFYILGAIPSHIIPAD